MKKQKKILTHKNWGENHEKTAKKIMKKQQENHEKTAKKS